MLESTKERRQHVLEYLSERVGQRARASHIAYALELDNNRVSSDLRSMAKDPDSPIVRDAPGWYVYKKPEEARRWTLEEAGEFPLAPPPEARLEHLKLDPQTLYVLHQMGGLHEEMQTVYGEVRKLATRMDQLASAWGL